MNRLKDLRLQKKISMRETANQLNIPYTTYVNYEKGTREPNSEMLIKLANYFNVSIDYLICRTDNAQTSSYSLPDITPPSEADPDQFVFDMYKKLDIEDKAEIRGTMKYMLKSSKYKKKKSDINAVFHTNSTDDDSAMLAFQTTTAKN